MHTNIFVYICIYLHILGIFVVYVRIYFVIFVPYSCQCSAIIRPPLATARYISDPSQLFSQHSQLFIYVSPLFGQFMITRSFRNLLSIVLYTKVTNTYTTYQNKNIYIYIYIYIYMYIYVHRYATDIQDPRPPPGIFYMFSI